MKPLLPIIAMALAACSAKEEIPDRAIRTEAELVDVRISEAAPTAWFNKDELVSIGFDAEGLENRMLLYFPKLHRLWSADVIVSSIAAVEVVLHCNDVQVNPDNIELRALTTPWTQLATWTSPFPQLPGKAWATPGGDLGHEAVTPSVRADDAISVYKELTFDITNFVREMILAGRKNYGFAIQVRRSALNAADQLELPTRNFSLDQVRPVSILAFSTKEAFE